MDTGNDRVAVLLSRLDPEPPQPSTVDIQRILAGARRRKQIRTVARRTAVAMLAGALAGTGVAVAAPRTPHPVPYVIDQGPSPSELAQQPPPPSACAVHFLPAPDGLRNADVLGLDPTGRYAVGRGADTAGRYHPLLWTDGVPKVLESQGIDGTLDGIVVNQAGAVAWSGSNQGRRGTWHYRDGAITPVPPAFGYVVKAIDAQGGIYAVDQGPEANHKWHARLLAVPADGPATVRDLQAADTAGAGLVLAVDTDGTAVGLADTGKLPLTKGPSQAAVWPPDGGMRLLTLPPGFGAAAAAVVSGGRIGGTAWHRPDQQDPTDQPVVVAWDDGASPPRPPVMLPEIFAINRYGWLVGADPDRHPVLVAGDQVLRLPVPLGELVTTVTGISTDGRVIVGQQGQGGKSLPLRWICA
jgi:hypothetical protein